MMLLIILGLATARLTRLAIDDTIIDNQRDWFRGTLLGEWVMDDVDHPRRARLADFLLRLTDCAWCLSAWVAAVAVLVADLAGQNVPVPPITWAAVWWVGSVGYWLGELIFETHNDLWDQRERRP